MAHHEPVSYLVSRPGLEGQQGHTTRPQNVNESRAATSSFVIFVSDMRETSHSLSLIQAYQICVQLHDLTTIQYTNFSHFTVTRFPEGEQGLSNRLKLAHPE